METGESAFSLIQNLLKWKGRFPLASKDFESAKSAARICDPPEING